MSGILSAPLEGVITQRFGENPDGYRVFGLAAHNGLDYGVPQGSQVRAAAAGVVQRAGADNSGYGLNVRIEHAELGLLTLYGHLSVVDVRPGQSVQRGQVIALSGNTGNSSGPHLHFEVKGPGGPENMGGAVDPWPLLYPPADRLYQVRVLARLGVNIREKPGKDGRIVGGAAVGDLLDVYEEAGGWVRVDPAGKGWACVIDDGNVLLMRADLDGGVINWQTAIDAWARELGFAGPRP